MFREVKNVVGSKEAFSIPFSKEKLDELYQKRNTNPEGPEQVQKCYKMKDNGTTVSVNKYEDFRDGDFRLDQDFKKIKMEREIKRVRRITNIEDKKSCVLFFGILLFCLCGFSS
jgi:hypothetical protein